MIVSGGLGSSIWTIVGAALIAFFSSTVTLIVQRVFDERRQTRQFLWDRERDLIQHKRKLFVTTAVLIDECSRLYMTSLRSVKQSDGFSKEQMSKFERNVRSAITKMQQAEARTKLCGEPDIAKEIGELAVVFGSLTKHPDNEDDAAREKRIDDIRSRIGKQRAVILEKLAAVYEGGRTMPK